jgi:hypothetical protein
MSQWKMVDLECATCGHQEERTVHRDCLQASDDRTMAAGETCNAEYADEDSRSLSPCGGPMYVVLSAVMGHTMVRGNSDYNERHRERLEKRSSEHFKKEGRDEAMERQRSQWKREGIVS